MRSSCRHIDFVGHPPRRTFPRSLRFSFHRSAENYCLCSSRERTLIVIVRQCCITSVARFTLDRRRHEILYNWYKSGDTRWTIAERTDRRTVISKDVLSVAPAQAWSLSVWSPTIFYAYVKSYISFVSDCKIDKLLVKNYCYFYMRFDLLIYRLNRRYDKNAILVNFN